jgi:hypothetical protein
MYDEIPRVNRLLQISLHLLYIFVWNAALVRWINYTEIYIFHYRSDHSSCSLSMCSEPNARSMLACLMKALAMSPNTATPSNISHTFRAASCLKLASVHCG